tara:strand:+ start:6125 stop:6991 length:867 start_codon:yes stop_codon:yes gene_type:complete
MATGATHAPNSTIEAPAVQAKANRVRILALEMAYRAKMGHLGGDFSCLDILTVLYQSVLNVDPNEPSSPDRDRFVLSKGHVSGALYATLATAGFFPLEQLESYMAPLSKLNGHPNRLYTPGVEANTGPLGHGLPIAVGMAIGAKLQNAPWRVFALTGDGELQEGSNWEAAMTAGHRKLDNLTVIVDRNRLQQGDGTENTVGLDPLDAKWAAFGWAVKEVDGHDHQALFDALEPTPSETGRPTCIIANTTKGKGVSFMENKAAWHHKIPNADEFEAALIELGQGTEADQ